MDAVGDTAATIIRDDARITRAERELRHAHTSQAGLDPGKLNDVISAAVTEAKAKLKALKAKGETISIADMFEMQILMDQLTQLSEMSTSVVSASNTAIASMARNIKS